MSSAWMALQNKSVVKNSQVPCTCTSVYGWAHVQSVVHVPGLSSLSTIWVQDTVTSPKTLLPVQVMLTGPPISTVKGSLASIVTLGTAVKKIICYSKTILKFTGYVTQALLWARKNLHKSINFLQGLSIVVTLKYFNDFRLTHNFKTRSRNCDFLLW